MCFASGVLFKYNFPYNSRNTTGNDLTPISMLNESRLTQLKHVALFLALWIVSTLIASDFNYSFGGEPMFGLAMACLITHVFNRLARRYNF